MKIAVVDDLKEDRNLLLDLLRQFFDRYDFKTEYDEFCCAGDFLKTLKPDAYDPVSYTHLFVNKYICKL